MIIKRKIVPCFEDKRILRKDLTPKDIQNYCQDKIQLIGHTGDLLADIYTAKYGAYLHFTVVLNDGGKGAQSRRNGCSI